MDRILEGTDAILIEPGSSDRAALRQIVNELKAGNQVVIFPEGTRSKDGRLQAFKGGAVLSAKIAGVPIIPCGVEGRLQLGRSTGVGPGDGRSMCDLPARWIRAPRTSWSS